METERQWILYFENLKKKYQYVDYLAERFKAKKLRPRLEGMVQIQVVAHKLYGH